MDKVNRFLDDDQFVCWVNSSDNRLDEHWENYFREHPDERAEAREARLILSQLQSVKEPVTPSLVGRIYNNILKEIYRRRKADGRRRIVYTIFRYAAVVVFSVSLGAFFMHRYYHRTESPVASGMYEKPESNEAKLILSDGRVIGLAEKESVVEYGTGGDIVINRQDTIKREAKVNSGAMNQLVMPYGKHTSLRLPDGTTAYLNAGSKLVYPSAFSGRSREVALTGEGYFEVAHNPDQPFTVKTGNLTITALGTRFNVSSYPTDNFIETVLVDGKVIIRDNGFRLFRKEIEVVPGEAVIFDKLTSQTTTRKIDVETYATWHLGYLQFQTTDLNRIVAKLERYYDIRIYLETPMLGMRRITGKLKLSDERANVLDALASTARAELKNLGDNMYVLK